MTGPPVESVSSGVISTKELRLIIFIAEMNRLELFGADIGNAYLEAKTKEKVCFIAGKSLVTLKGICSSSTKLFMDSRLLASDGTKDLLIVYVR